MTIKFSENKGVFTYLFWMHIKGSPPNNISFLYQVERQSAWVKFNRMTITIFNVEDEMFGHRYENTFDLTKL